MSHLDQRHIETIARILEAIAVVESDPARAALACEDAYVALSIGFSFGLTTQQIAKQHDTLMAEFDALNPVTLPEPSIS